MDGRCSGEWGGGHILAGSFVRIVSGRAFLGQHPLIVLLVQIIKPTMSQSNYAYPNNEPIGYKDFSQ